MKSKNIIVLLLISFCCLVVVSCKKDDSSKNKTIFRYNESANISSLDPAFAKDQAMIWADNQIFNGLLQLDSSLNVQPCIAKSYQISEDKLTYTFHLRNDVFFHDSPLFNGKKRKVVASYPKFISMIRKAKTIKIEAPFFNSGTQVFTFNVSGLEWNH